MSYNLVTVPHHIQFGYAVLKHGRSYSSGLHSQYAHFNIIKENSTLYELLIFHRVNRLYFI